MILIGQFDSPFVRRVGVALELLGFEYEHRPWSVFGDADRIAPVNPLIRVPTLVLDSGEVLTETFVILEVLDERAGPERALTPARGPARLRTLMISALASGVCDKTVSLVYESRIHQRATETWIDRCLRQVSGGLDQIDALVGANPHSWLVSDRIGAADIAVATMWRFVVQTQSGRLDPARWPMIARHSETCESRPEFRRIYQPYTFTPPQTSQSS